MSIRKANGDKENGNLSGLLYRTSMKDNPAFSRSGSMSSRKSSIKVKPQPPKETVKSVGLIKLFSYSTAGDLTMIIVAVIMSMGLGVSWPLIILVFGTTTDVLSTYQFYLFNLIATLRSKNVTVLDNESLNSLVDKMKIINPNFVLDPKYDIFAMMNIMSQYFSIIALCVLVLSYISVTCLVISSQNQVARIRNAFFRAVMRQNIGWFDEQNSGALTNKLIDDMNTIHAGIGDKIGQMVQWFSCCLGGIVLAFVKGWKLTLVTLAISPLIVIAMAMLSRAMMKLNQRCSEAYGKAGGIAEEVLGAIRTVVSFGGEKFEVNRYSSNLEDACQSGIRKSILTGTLLGLVMGLMFGSYSIGFWYGSQLIRDGEIKVGEMLIIFFSCMMATMGLGNATPHLASLNEARNTAAEIYEIIDRIPEIDKMNESGKKIDNFQGDITFKDVNFHYPTRTDCPVLKGLSLKISKGQTVALVGASGCGKSSLIQLIQRFYDSISGEILIDGINIKELNVMWLRQQIGVVSQEPVLFGCSIRENIRYGRLDVTDTEIEEALEMANAKTFIDSLPKRLDTLVGDRGTQLSGGQKQRIAIARALVRNPKILLLDEATSALDSESEKIVQNALDKVVIGRTTVIVAHRLSTVRNADVIFGIKDGVVVESGNHDSLIAIDGLYKDLVDRQKIDQQDEGNTNENVYENEPSTRKQSLLKEAIETDLDKVEVKLEGKKHSSDFLRVLKLNRSEVCYIFLGCVAAIFNGAAQPAFAVIFGHLMQALGNPDLVKQKADVTIYVIVLACLAAVIFFANVLQSIGFGNSGEQLTKKCRKITFEAMLKQDIAWFDKPENNIGALTTRLSDEASQIRGISGESLGSFFQAVASMGAAVVLALVFCWQIALTVLAFVPIIFIGGILQVKIMQGFSNSDKGALEESGKIAVECIENIRTVSNLTREYTFIEKYKLAVTKLTGDVSRKGHVQGFLYGLTQAAVFCAYAAAFILAGYLLKNNSTEMKNVFIAFGALIFGAMNLGKSMAMAPNYGKGKKAAANMFELLDRVPSIDTASDEGVKLDLTSAKGEVKMENVHFSYPLRPEVVILNNVSLDINANKTIALVGPSGCGKSTIIQLLLRFYDISKGIIYVDQTTITSANIKSLRLLFSIVSQEPTLFSYSIKENIAYAKDGEYTEAEVIEAAKASNIHDFISNLPDKYETKVGEKGSNFSGGQKQRIAIARALLRNPKILLLDEATSALDTESEKIVQDALDKAQEGRTCIVIAHRLSTIQNADKIIVFKDGKIAESGTHFELLSKDGIYAKMIQLQSHK